MTRKKDEGFLINGEEGNKQKRFYSLLVSSWFINIVDRKIHFAGHPRN